MATRSGSPGLWSNKADTVVDVFMAHESSSCHSMNVGIVRVDGWQLHVRCPFTVQGRVRALGTPNVVVSRKDVAGFYVLSLDTWSCGLKIKVLSAIVDA